MHVGDGCPAFEKMEQEGRGDVVGQVAHDAKGGPGPCQFAEVGAQGILDVDFQTALTARVTAQGCTQVTVDLDDFVLSGGSAQPWPIGMPVQFQNGVCLQNPAIHAGRTEFQFGQVGGWVSSQPFSGQLFVFGQLGLTPKGCYANCDGSTTPPALNVLDFACFLNKYASGDPEANCDGSTTPPVLNVLDFACFLNQYAQGGAGN